MIYQPDMTPEERQKDEIEGRKLFEEGIQSRQQVLRIILRGCSFFCGITQPVRRQKPFRSGLQITLLNRRLTA